MILISYSYVNIKPYWNINCNIKMQFQYFLNCKYKEDSNSIVNVEVIFSLSWYNVILYQTLKTTDCFCDQHCFLLRDRSLQLRDSGTFYCRRKKIRPTAYLSIWVSPSARPDRRNRQANSDTYWSEYKFIIQGELSVSVLKCIRPLTAR